MAVMFHGQILSGYQKTEYAEKYGRSLFLSGWRLISRIGFNRVEMCTGPVVPRGGNLTAGSGSTVLFLLVTGMGILMGAGGALVANAWFMSLYFF